MSYEELEKEAEEIRSENEALLHDFGEWLSVSGLKTKTVRKHIQNVDFYINDYLLYDDCNHAKDGVSSLNVFFQLVLS